MQGKRASLFFLSLSLSPPPSPLVVVLSPRVLNLQRCHRVDSKPTVIVPHTGDSHPVPCLNPRGEPVVVRLAKLACPRELHVLHRQRVASFAVDFALILLVPIRLEMVRSLGSSLANEVPSHNTLDRHCGEVHGDHRARPGLAHELCSARASLSREQGVQRQASRGRMVL